MLLDGFWAQTTPLVSLGFNSDSFGVGALMVFCSLLSCSHCNHYCVFRICFQLHGIPPQSRCLASLCLHIAHANSESCEFPFKQCIHASNWMAAVWNTSVWNRLFLSCRELHDELRLVDVVVFGHDAPGGNDRVELTLVARMRCPGWWSFAPFKGHAMAQNNPVSID